MTRVLYMIYIAIALTVLALVLVVANATAAVRGQNELDGGGQGTTCAWSPTYLNNPGCDIFAGTCVFGAWTWRGGPNDGEVCAQ